LQKINKQLKSTLGKNVYVINSVDTKKFIERLNEISNLTKDNIKTIKSYEYKGKVHTVIGAIKVFNKNNIFKSSLHPTKTYVLRSQIPYKALLSKKDELEHVLNTNVINMGIGSSKKIILVKTCKKNIQGLEKMTDKIQFLLNELNFKVTNVTEDEKDSMKIYNITTTTEFEKFKKKTSHIAFRLGIEEEKLYMRKETGIVQLIITGDSKTYPFVEYIGLKEIKRKTKDMQVPAVLGINLESGKLVCVDLAKFPHALAMGGTGSGKSNFLNVLIQSSMYLTSNLAYLMFDFKKVELNQYKNFKNVTFINNYDDAIKAIDLLNKEMNRRLDLFAAAGVKDLESYNLKYENIPYLVTIIDEAADIKLEAGDKKTAEEVNTALNQCINKARCSGIIIIYAMQRADGNQISCSIRDQLMSRIGFNTSSEKQKQFIELENLTTLKTGEFILKYRGEESKVKGFFIDDRKLQTNEVYKILKKNFVKIDLTKNGG
jgi:hypothetical protein